MEQEKVWRGGLVLELLAACAPPRLPRLASLHALSSDVLVGRFLVAVVATVRRRGLAPVAALEALGDGPLIHVDVAL